MIPAVSGWQRVEHWSSFRNSSGVETEKSGLQMINSHAGISGRLSSFSPRPVAKAVPPRTQKGTSDPTSADNASSSSGEKAV